VTADAVAIVKGKKMKILVGIDSQGLYRPVLNLLGRMRLDGSEMTLAHSVDLMFPMPMYGISAEAALGAEFANGLRAIGEQALEEAADLACGRNMKADTILLSGAAGPALIEFADREHYDLIAIESERKGKVGTLFLGSVARGLAIGAHQSVLISKGDHETTGPLKAVFATDHSDFANRALDLFIQMRPQGIESVHVIAAAWMNEYDAYVAQYDLAKLSGSTQEWVEAQLRQKNADLVEKLSAAGFKATATVKAAAPDQAIREAMQMTKADLLVVGAQGHGFIHRLFIGSTSLHQVVVEPYSVLVLRPTS
jgi:nucleotide-binding universal stress UspA family protein